jgi:hypothetical protein
VLKTSPIVAFLFCFSFQVLKHDFDFWGIDEMLLEPCCALKYYPEMEVCSKEQEGERKSKQKMRQKMIDEDFGDSCIGKLRTKAITIFFACSKAESNYLSKERECHNENQ